MTLTFNFKVTGGLLKVRFLPFFHILAKIILWLVYIIHTVYTASRHKLAAVISWPLSSYFEISINLKACIIIEWSIIIRFMIKTTFKPCATTHLSV